MKNNETTLYDTFHLVQDVFTQIKQIDVPELMHSGKGHIEPVDRWNQTKK